MFERSLDEKPDDPPEVVGVTVPAMLDGELGDDALWPPLSGGVKLCGVDDPSDPPELVGVTVPAMLDGELTDDALWPPLSGAVKLCGVDDPCHPDDPPGISIGCPARIMAGSESCGFAASTAARLTPWLAAIPERVSPG
jgi:hypothetical protein